MNSAQAALRYLGSALAGNLDREARAERDRANTDLSRAAMAAGLARQNRMDKRQEEIDALQRPGLELTAGRDRAALGAMARPVTLPENMLPGAGNIQPNGQEFRDRRLMVGDFAGTVGDVGHLIHTKQGQPIDTAPIFALAKAAGGVPDLNTGAIVKPDGTPLTWGDLEANRDRVMGALMLTTDLGRKRHQKAAELQDLLQRGKTPDGKPFTRKDFDEALAALSDPGMMIQDLTAQRQELEKHAGWLGEAAVAGKIAKIDAQIAKAYELVGKRADKASDREFELKKLGIQERGKDRRAKAKDGGVPALAKEKYKSLLKARNETLKIISEGADSSGPLAQDALNSLHGRIRGIDRQLKDIESMAAGPTAAIGQAGQPIQAQNGTQRVVLDGQAAAEAAAKLVGQIDAGTVNPEIIIAQMIKTQPAVYQEIRRLLEEREQRQTIQPETAAGTQPAMIGPPTGNSPVERLGRALTPAAMGLGRIINDPRLRQLPAMMSGNGRM